MPNVYDPEGNIVQRNPTESGVLFLGAVQGILIFLEVIPNDPALLGSLAIFTGLLAPVFTKIIRRVTG